MLVVAHRGGSPGDVDNSAAAFIHAIQTGADLLECDLQLAADGDIVVYHDSEYFGAPISSFSTDELRALVPTLLTFDEFLDLLHEQAADMRLVLDLKTRDVDRSLVSYLEDAQLRRRVLVTSTFSFGLLRLKRRYPDLRTGLSRGATFTRIPARLRPLVARTAGRIMLWIAIVLMAALKIDTAAFKHELLDRRSIETLHRHGIRVDAWTVDSVTQAQDLQRLGVDYLTTNRPAEMISSLRNTT